MAGGLITAGRPGFKVLLSGVELERAIFPPEVRGKTQED